MWASADFCIEALRRRAAESAEKKEGIQMDTTLIRDINKLWLPVYPGLAKQVAGYCLQPPRRILEVGCFSGGTGLELLKLFPQSRLTVALELPELAETFFDDWRDGLESLDASHITIIPTPLVPLAAAEAAYDLVFCRGVFFFLDDQGSLLAEMYRAVAHGGTVFAGGGFGSHTPQAVIEPIADESRRLNYALGKAVVSPEQFKAMLKHNGIMADIVQEGGLWAVLRK
jgi:SAM-dependent methyltransferase